MLILGIESSCDETACAIVKEGRVVLANVIASQIGIHQATNGVVPEVAARAHVGKVQIVLEKALEESGLNWQDIDAIAVTAGPGLLSSVMVGVNFAATLAWIQNKPLIPVNHIHGHILSALLDCTDEVKFPIATLSVSGGHNDLYLVNGFNEIQLLGQTQDDAAGEAYDKAAKMLGLEYPGGPAISKLALEGDKNRFKLPKPVLKKGYEFSFSGLKSAFARLIEELKSEGIFEDSTADLAASFQETVNEILSYKLLKAAEEFKCQEIHLVGGVSANKNLREKISEQKSNRVEFRYPKEFSYCTDNAAMIAGAAFYQDKATWLKPGEVPKLITWD